MQLSLSRHRTLAYLSKLGENHDARVIEWKSSIEQEMKSSKVLFPIYESNMSVLSRVDNKRKRI